MKLYARVHSALIQWAVVSSYWIPVTMVVIGHDVDKVKVSVGLEIFVQYICSFVKDTEHMGPLWSHSTCKIGLCVI